MDNETKTASEIWDIMEELGIAVDVFTTDYYSIFYR